MRMSLLASSAGVLLLLLGCGSVDGSPTSANTTVAGPRARVIVVGGGFAGLAAATELERTGHSVTLLEAQDHLGGRAFTDRSHFDFPLDMGAMWIHGIKNNPIYELAQQVGLKTRPTDYENLQLHDASGKAIGNTEIEALYDTFAAELDRQRGVNDPYASLGEAMERAFQKLQLTKEQQDQMRFKVCDEIELDVSATVYNISGNYYDADDYMIGGDVMVTDDNGYARLIDHIAASLQDVRLSTPVSKIDYSGASGVSVHTSAGVIDADFVVVTVSLGVLKTNLIDFTPALPADIQHAIQYLGCDVSDKVVMEFPKGSASHWGGAQKEYFHIMNRETAHHGEFTETWNLKFYRDLDVLMSFSVGPRDWALVESQPSDEEVGRSALAQLRLAFPTLPEPSKVRVQRWGLDKYSRCSWSSWFVGSSQREREAFHAGARTSSSWDDRVVFAGEHVSSHYPGTTHGAWITGLDAAAGIHLRHTGLGAVDAAATRTRMQAPAAEDAFRGRPMRSRKKEWSRMMAGKAAIV